MNRVLFCRCTAQQLNHFLRSIGRERTPGMVWRFVIQLVVSIAVIEGIYDGTEDGWRDIEKNNFLNCVRASATD